MPVCSLIDDYGQFNATPKLGNKIPGICNLCSVWRLVAMYIENGCQDADLEYNESFHSFQHNFEW